MRSLCGTVMLLALLSATRAQDKPRDVSWKRGSKEVRLIGMLGEPFGTVVTAQGRVIHEPTKGPEVGPKLRVQRINGKATQEDIQICVIPYFNEFGKKAKAVEGEPLPALTSGKTYEFEGYETGSFVGTPRAAYKRAGIAIQSVDFYFMHEFVVYKAVETKPIKAVPSEFVDRVALLEGVALSHESRAYIGDKNWMLLTDPDKPWAKDVEGKVVEAVGVIKKTENANVFRLEKGTTRLVKLEDQVGRSVALRGIARSLNGEWWFEYRGVDLHVENMNNMFEKAAGVFNAPVLITGTLEEDLLPAIDQISIKSDRDKKKYFVVRKPSWEKIESLLAPERAER